MTSFYGLGRIKSAVSKPSNRTSSKIVHFYVLLRKEVWNQDGPVLFVVSTQSDRFVSCKQDGNPSPRARELLQLQNVMHFQDASIVALNFVAIVIGTSFRILVSFT